MAGERRWEPIEIRPKWAEYLKPTAKPIARDGWELVTRSSTIRELQNQMVKLRERGQQVETLTTQIAGKMAWRVINHLLWKNLRTGVYLAETRVELPIKAPIKGKGYREAYKYTTRA